jgi:UDP-glucose 4-epimerase
VTGGAGFIGSHLVDWLVEVGAEVTVLDDLSSGVRSNLPEGLHLITIDVAESSAVTAIADARPELVIHAAAQVSVPRSMQDPARDRAVNLIGTEHVLEGAQRAGAGRIVFISSGGAVYGETTMATETDAPAPASFYGVHKLAAEAYVRLSGLPHGIVRLPNIYGPRQRSDLEGGVVAIFADSLRDHRPITIFGTGEQVRDFLYVKDAVAGIVAVATAPMSGTWNVSTGTAVSIRALLGQLETLTGVTAAVRWAAARSGDVGASCLANDMIAADLSWAPRYSLAAGLTATLEA